MKSKLSKTPRGMKKRRNYSSAATQPAEKKSFRGFMKHMVTLTPDEVGWATGLFFVVIGVSVAEGIKLGKRKMAEQQGNR